MLLLVILYIHKCVKRILNIQYKREYKREYKRNEYKRNDDIFIN